MTRVLALIGRCCVGWRHDIWRSRIWKSQIHVHILTQLVNSIKMTPKPLTSHCLYFSPSSAPWTWLPTNVSLGNTRNTSGAARGYLFPPKFRFGPSTTPIWSRYSSNWHGILSCWRRVSPVRSKFCSCGVRACSKLDIWWGMVQSVVRRTDST